MIKRDIGWEAMCDANLFNDTYDSGRGRILDVQAAIGAKVWILGAGVMHAR